MSQTFDDLYVAATNLRQAQRDYMEVRNGPRETREEFGRAVAEAADKLDDVLASVDTHAERGRPLTDQERLENLAAWLADNSDEDGLDPIGALVCDAAAAEPSRMVHEGGEYYAERVIRRAIAQGTLVLASADTHPKDGDVKQAPLVSGLMPRATNNGGPREEGVGGIEPLVERVARAICGRDLERHDCERACLAAGRCVGNLSECVIGDARAAIAAYEATRTPEAAQVEMLVRNAYEEGVEDGIGWHCYPESGPQPQWIDSVARVELLTAYPALAQVRHPSGEQSS
jgi:dsDNA-binding SOS-regulon protein